MLCISHWLTDTQQAVLAAGSLINEVLFAQLSVLRSYRERGVNTFHMTRDVFAQLLDNMGKHIPHDSLLCVCIVGRQRGVNTFYITHDCAVTRVHGINTFHITHYCIICIYISFAQLLKNMV